MIQRIQTVYLLLTTFISILFLSGDIIFFENGTALTLMGITGKIEGTSMENIERSWPLTALLLATTILPVVIIFIYKNRKLQIRLTVFLILLIVITAAVLGYYIYLLTGKNATEIVFSYKLVIPLLMLVLSSLALRGIKKDENIVRSYDRLR